MMIPRNLTRRAFAHRFVVSALVAASALWAFLMSSPRRALAGSPERERTVATDDEKRKWGMAIDLDRCTGCGACVVACRTENNVPATGSAEESDGTDILWMNLLPLEDRSEGSESAPEMLPLPCLHCEDPPCVPVCPVGATYQTGDGIVAQIYDRCIGCRFCEVACPYGVRFFNWDAPEWPTSHLNTLNPDVATRPAGVVEKCTFCSHRIRSVTESARVDGVSLSDTDFQSLPACAESCPAEAIVFGDLNDPGSRVALAATSPRADQLLEHLGTKPKVFHLRRERRH